MIYVVTMAVRQQNSNFQLFPFQGGEKPPSWLDELDKSMAAKSGRDLGQFVPSKKSAPPQPKPRPQPKQPAKTTIVLTFDKVLAFEFCMSTLHDDVPVASLLAGHALISSGCYEGIALNTFEWMGFLGWYWTKARAPNTYLQNAIVCPWTSLFSHQL